MHAGWLHANNLLHTNAMSVGRHLFGYCCLHQGGLGSSAGAGAAVPGAGVMGGNMGGVGNGMPSAGQQMMSVEAYVEHCRQFTAQKGVPFNEVQVRQYYHGMRAQMGL